MLRKVLFGFLVAFFMLLLLIIGVAAQDDDDSGSRTVTVQVDTTAANVVQTVPVTLTLSLPGPDGPVTAEVPIFLSLDIRVGISDGLTPMLTVASNIEIETGVPDEESTPPAITPPSVTNAEATVTEEITEESVSIADDSSEEPTPTPSATAEDADDPAAAPLPTTTATPTVTVEPVAVSPPCPDPRALITSPGANEVVSGTVEITGRAVHENFQYYKMEYAQGENIDPNNTFSYLADARVQVEDSLLAAVDSTIFSNGPYTVKLTVVDNSGNFPPPCTVSVVIAN